MKLPDGYTMRPPTRDDAPAVAALIAACQAADGDEPTNSWATGPGSIWTKSRS